jgi:riboflavin kinase/FMN adenylyltransferase
MSYEMEQMKPCVATIGFFDGVHLGHQFLINNIKKEAAKRGMESTVVTFDRHPRVVLQKDYQPQMISRYEEKLVLLSQTGVDNCVILPFDKEMASLSAYDFMKEILSDRLHVKVLIIGYDNHFGHSNGNEGFDDYVGYGKQMGIEVIRANAVELHGVKISSSVIRSFVTAGEVEMAAECLGRPYCIFGHVVNGFGEGHKLGFPTANIDPDSVEKIVPVRGVYAVKVRIAGTIFMKHAMMNIGVRPTFNGNDLTMEVHIFNFNDDIYDKNIAVYFIHRVRAEQKFKNTEELVSQLKEDERLIKEQFEKEIEE